MNEKTWKVNVEEVLWCQRGWDKESNIPLNPHCPQQTPHDFFWPCFKLRPRNKRYQPSTFLLFWAQNSGLSSRDLLFINRSWPVATPLTSQMTDAIHFRLSYLPCWKTGMATELLCGRYRRITSENLKKFWLKTKIGWSTNYQVLYFQIVINKCISKLWNISHIRVIYNISLSRASKGDTRVRLALEQCSLYFVLTPPTQVHVHHEIWNIKNEKN